MMSENEQMEELMLRVLRQEATKEELDYFADWLKDAEHLHYFEQFKKLWNLTSGPWPTEERTKAELQHFVRFMQKNKRIEQPRNRRSIYKIAGWAAACMLPFLLAVWGWQQWGEQEVSVPLMTEITPGCNKALLTLASGEQVVLEPGKGGDEKLGEHILLDDKNNALHYSDNQAGNAAMSYDCLQIPRGGEFSVNLADGTVVHLNSSSLLRYPSSFDGKERKVYLSGEAYFEVKKESGRPFLVVTDAATIRVYGTSFNVSTNQGGSTQTVLVEGSVGIKGNRADATEYVLKPNQLANYNLDGTVREIVDVNVRPFIAWKDGLFVFEDESLENIMNRLSLWYDVDVVFTSDRIKAYHFTGYMERYEQFDRILNAIHKMVGVEFSIHEKTITISE